MTSIVAARDRKPGVWGRIIATSWKLAVFAPGIWGIGALCRQLHANRSTTTSSLLLATLAVATIGDSVLAMLTAVTASLCFSYYFIDEVGSLVIRTPEGLITFMAMSITALVGSQLSIRATKRAAEAIHRRQEMERLQQIGSVLLSAVTVAEAAQSAVEEMYRLFGLDAVILRVAGEPEPFRVGTAQADDVSVSSLGQPGIRESGDTLELYGEQPSAEVRAALASMIGLVIDRARSSEARTRLEAARRGEELRSTVLNALAHDFKTPLTSIKAAASALRTSTLLRDSVDSELAIVLDEEADRLGKLIQESLDLARLQQHNAQPRMEECNLADIVRGATARISRYLGVRRLDVDVPEELPAVIGDRFLLEQMLLQVMDNASKYSKPGSAISVTGQQSGQTLVLTIQNDGGAIPESEQRLIFHKFYRGKQTSAAVEGTGLGLSIAKTIAETHGGKLWLDMEPRGPAFRFALPVAPGNASTSAPAEEEGKRDHEPYHFVDR